MTANVDDHELLHRGTGNWFFLEPAFTPLSDEWCTKLLSSGPATTRNLIFVTTKKTPDDQMALWQAHVKPELPARIGFIDLLGFSRRGASESIQTAERDGCEIRIKTVQPGNLTKIGIILSNHLAQWAEEDDCVAVCFDSLTSLLQFVEVRTLYRFIHELTNQVRAVDGLAHYHLDPQAHEEQIVSKFMALFDGVVEPDGDGDWQIRTR